MGLVIAPLYTGSAHKPKVHVEDRKNHTMCGREVTTAWTRLAYNLDALLKLYPERICQPCERRTKQ